MMPKTWSAIKSNSNNKVLGATMASDKKIVVSKNGPYVVTGGVPLSIQTIIPNEDGLSWEWKKGRTFKIDPVYNLCRCGHSKNKPFCDGTHEKIRFEGKETATRQPFARQAKTYDGPTLTLSDAENLCAFARFCDPGGKIWSLIENTNNPKLRKLVIREATNCPSGRLVLHDKKTGKQIEPEFSEPSIAVIEDPVIGCSGPLWIQGGIRIESEGGKPYERRNRVTVCRCGAAANMPFCNGSHASIMFKDGLSEL